tara:strand:+ start:2866 stop:3786 length:921 start_codon:yes stop_codon:yes gene_type:complete
MRDAFAKEMKLIAESRKDLVLLSGDIGNRMFDAFKETAPNQFINCGIAEANMMSMAAGLALSGMRPVVYTITPFTTTRCLEQIKVGVAYHDASVVIVGTGSGLSYSELGPTHHSLEDIAILRSIPGIRILTPADRNELIAQLRESLELKGPTYIRIGKKGEPNLHKNLNNLGVGKGNLIMQGNDYLIIGVGPILNEAIMAAEKLKDQDISVAVASLGGVKPLDSTFLHEMRNKQFKSWITIEEHSLIGGLGSALLEWESELKAKSRIRIERIGVPDKFIHELGNQQFTRKQLGLDSNGIIKKIQTL